MGAQPLPSPVEPKSPTAAVERRLIEELRAVPPSPLRDRVVALIGDLLAFAAAPTCPESQADGVPCPTAINSCDSCRRAITLLDDFEARIRQN